MWAGAASCQALKCPSLLVETSRVVWLSVGWQKHMAVIWASWGAEMVVFSTKLHVTGVWLVIVTLFSSHERETLTDPAACSPQTNSCNICTSASVHRKPTASGSAPAQQLSDVFPPPSPTTSQRRQTPLWPPRTAVGPIHECTPAARCPAVGETDNVNLVSTLSNPPVCETYWELTLYSSLSLWSE